MSTIALLLKALLSKYCQNLLLLALVVRRLVGGVVGVERVMTEAARGLVAHGLSVVPVGGGGSLKPRVVSVCRKVRIRMRKLMRKLRVFLECQVPKACGIQDRQCFPSCPLKYISGFAL